MIKKIKKTRFLRNPQNAEKIEKNQIKQNTLHAEEKVGLDLSKSLDENLNKFKAFLADSTDAVFREFKIGKNNIPCALVYIDGLVNTGVINGALMKSLMLDFPQVESEVGEITIDKALEQIKSLALTVAEVKDGESLDQGMLMVLSGEVALLVEGHSQFIIVNARGWPSRGVAPPDTEGTVRGPREGFVETLRMNTALIRRKCKDPNLVIKSVQLGRRSKTDVAYMYIKGIASRELIAEVEKRLNEIDVDQIFESGQVEYWIQDNVMTPFPQMQVTERPDKTVANLMEGRVAIIVDNSPFAIIAPISFYQLLQSPEDYYENWIIGSFLRSLRWAASFLAAFAPAIYIALISFHPGFLPTKLVLAVAGTRANIPFPAFIEALLMEATIELLRESGARLPKAIGQTIGIVGGIVVGDAAIRAGITSPSMVIIVATTAIASFVIPSYSAAIAFRIIRFPLMIAAAILGLYGVALGFIFINIHLVSLKSFGVSYMAPQAPTIFPDWVDFIIRAPYKLLKERPYESYPVDIDRMEQG